MGLFSLTQELAIDLGTANTIIINNGKIVVDEPSIVALDQHSGKLVAIGKQARQMHGKTHQNIRTIRPLKDGVIADFNAAELMLRGLIKMVKSSGRLFSPSLKMVISIPSGSTNVEIRAVRWAGSSAAKASTWPATFLPKISRPTFARSITCVSANGRPKISRSP